MLVFCPTLFKFTLKVLFLTHDENISNWYLTLPRHSNILQLEWNLPIQNYGMDYYFVLLAVYDRAAIHVGCAHVLTSSPAANTFSLLEFWNQFSQPDDFYELLHLIFSPFKHYKVKHIKKCVKP